MDNDFCFPTELDLHAFFDGRCTALGMVMNRSGKVERRFRVEIEGRIQDGSLILDESFLFDDGETHRRVWTLENKGEVVLGTAPDVLGRPIGEITGPKLQWSYDVEIKVRGRKMRVRFDDWMALIGDGTMLSHAVIRKFGFRIADVFIAFRREDAGGL